MHPQTIKEPPPCLTVAFVFWWLNPVFGLRHTNYLASESCKLNLLSPGNKTLKQCKLSRELYFKQFTIKLLDSKNLRSLINILWRILVYGFHFRGNSSIIIVLMQSISHSIKTNIFSSVRFQWYFAVLKGFSLISSKIECSSLSFSIFAWPSLLLLASLNSLRNLLIMSWTVDLHFPVNSAISLIVPPSKFYLILIV